MESKIFTDVNLTLFSRAKVRALATVTIAGAVKVSGVRVIEGSKGLFVSMPQRKKADGEYKDVAFPTTKGMREELTNLVLAAFEAESAKVGSKSK